MFRVTYTYYGMPSSMTSANVDVMDLLDLLEDVYTGKLTIHFIYYKGKELDVSKILRQLKFK